MNRRQSLWLATSAFYEVCQYAAESRRSLRDLRVWEPCCGGGPAAVLFKVAGCGQVVATDLNAQALEACRWNAKRNGVVIDRIEEANLLDLAGESEFDAIICNPPCRPSLLCPADLGDLPRASIDGGPEGVDLHLALIEGACSRLVEGGRLLFVMVSTANYLKISKALNEHFPGAWRVSLNSPIAQPFIRSSDALAPALQRTCEEGQSLAWRHEDGWIWRLSWTVVAAKGGDRGWNGRLNFRNGVLNPPCSEGDGHPSSD